jgi:hypothetical protein
MLSWADENPQLGASMSGVQTFLEEPISACAWDEAADEVGPYSFTSALVIALQRVSKRVPFSGGELYQSIVFRTQSRMPEDVLQGGKERDRHPAPMHMV